MLGVSAGWTREAALDQAVGLGLHAGVVFVRGVLPAVLATGAACLIWRRTRGADPGAWATLGVSLPLAALVTVLVLTSAIRNWPRLELRSAADGITTVLLLGAAAAGADLLARRWLARRAGRLR